MRDMEIFSFSIILGLINHGHMDMEGGEVPVRSRVTRKKMKEKATKSPCVCVSWPVAKHASKCKMIMEVFVYKRMET